MKLNIQQLLILGQQITRKGKIADEYIRQLSDLGISLHSLKLLGDFEIPEEDKKLTERELIEKILTDSKYKKQKETIEKYILEFIRADLITQSTHLRRGKDLVNSKNENEIDGGVYIYRTPEKDKDGEKVEVEKPVEEKKGYIFVGESHVHKVEEALTENDIYVENPSTYVSNVISSGSNTYKYEYGTSGNGTGGNLFFVHTLYNGKEPEYNTEVGDMTQQAFPEWIYRGNSVSEGIRKYNGTATAFERVKKIISNNSDITSWNVIVMQGYASALLGQPSWDLYISDLCDMRLELAGLGGKLYVSSTPHSNAGIWQQDTCYSYGKNSVINNLEGPDSTDNNAIYDQYNEYIKKGFSNFINVTSSNTSNTKGKDGNNYKKYTQAGQVDSAFCFDNYAHIDINHYDSSTMYAWAEYIINILDGNVTQNEGTSGNINTPNVVTKTIDTAKYGLNAEKVNIKMDNINNEYKIAWISDLHMMQSNETDINEEWYNKHSTTFADRNNSFGNSSNLLPKIIECLNGNDFDAIVFGGDIMDNYSALNFEQLQKQISKITNKNVMFLAADHDYLTEMTKSMPIEDTKNALSSLGTSGAIKKIDIGKNGDSITLVGQNYANEKISDSAISTISNYLNNASNSLFFTHVPIESKQEPGKMQQWSRDVHNGQVYYWSNEATSEGYKPSSSYLDTLYNASSLKGVFAGHVHSTGDFNFNNGIREHIFKASYNKSIGVITISPSNVSNGNNQAGGQQGLNNNNQGSQQGATIDTTIQDVNQEKYVQMEYESPEKFQKLVDKQSKDLRYKYTIDNEGKLVIAQLKTVVTKTKKSDDLFASTKKETIVEDLLHIDYKQYIEKYTLPYEFLINLCMVTQNPEFVYHVAMLARQTEIKLVVQDDTTVQDVTKVETLQIQCFKNTSSSSRQGAEVTSDIITEVKIEEKTTTMVPHLEMQSANTWSFYEKYEYTKETYEDALNLRVERIPCEVPDTLPDHHEGTTENVIATTVDGVLTYETVTTPEYWTGGPWVVDKVVTTNTNITTRKYNPGILSNSVEKSKQFLGLLRNDTGKCKMLDCQNDSERAKECARISVFNLNGKNVEYPLPNSTNVDAPLNRLISGEQMLYDLLGASLHGGTGEEETDEINSEYKTKLSGIVDHMKYLMTFPVNEDLSIPYGRDEYIIPDGDIDYGDISQDEEELQILYKVCQAEAGGSKTAEEIGHVASVVLNRVKSPRFPNTIKEVVYQANQFSCVAYGSFDKAVPSEKTKGAVDSVLASGDTTGGAFWFRTKKSAQKAGMPTSALEKHDFYVYLFEDINTHIFYTNPKYLAETGLGSPEASDNMVGAAIEVHKFVRENGYSYKQLGVNVPNYKTKTIDCSSYVSWAILNAGYRSNKFKEGMYQWTSITFYNNSEGWEVIKDISNARAGDIICYTGHVEIYAGSTKGKKPVVYNCGGNASIAAKESSTSSHTTSQIKKILRVPI